MTFYVYLVLCSDNSFYCGYANDLKKRIKAHNSFKGGAKYTRSRQPVVLKYFEKFSDLTSALKREYEIKAMSRGQKLELTEVFK